MNESKVAKEISKMKREPWLAVETSLVVWSLASGAVLLAILVWVSYRFFPAGT